MFPRSIVFNKKHHWQKKLWSFNLWWSTTVGGSLMVSNNFWNFHPETREMIHFDDCAYFSNGLVKNHQLESHQVLAQLFFFETGAPTPWVRTLTLILTMPSTTCLVMTDGFFSAKCREAAGNTPLLNEKETKNTHKHPADRCGETCCDKQHQKMIEDERRLQYF